MPATTQLPDGVVAHLGYHLGRARVLAEEILAHVGTIIGLERLVVAVQRIHHDLAQGAVLVPCQQRVPVAAPDQFDDVPARATKLALQLLDDLAVASHRTVQALQIAVDDENQVVQALTRCQSDRAEALHLVHLAVTTKHPYLAVVGLRDATRLQVLEKSRLVNCHQWAQAHRHGGELPELGHQLRVRVAGEAAPIDLLAEIQQLLLCQPALQKGARINPR